MNRARQQAPEKDGTRDDGAGYAEAFREARLGQKLAEDGYQDEEQKRPEHGYALTVIQLALEIHVPSLQVDFCVTPV